MQQFQRPPHGKKEEYLVRTSAAELVVTPLEDGTWKWQVELTNCIQHGFAHTRQEAEQGAREFAAKALKSVLGLIAGE